MFATIPAGAPDPLYAVAARYAADPRAERIDLGVGVYRDASGRSPVMAAIKTAEGRLLDGQDSKAYRPLLGDPDFLRMMKGLVLGDDYPALLEHRVVAIQAAGGTGALRLAAALVASAGEGARVHLGTPTWPSHAGLFASEGIAVVEHSYWQPGEPAPLQDGVRAAARAARSSDVFVMHGPCHNPTGVDLSLAERRDILAALDHSGAVPLLDIAYYGLADGVDADLETVRDLFARSRRAIATLSCSKAFGLYRERVGLLLVLCADAGEATRVADRLGRLSRLLVSTPPAHGAEAVALVLRTPELQQAWRDEIDGMRDRIQALRKRLAGSGLPAFDRIEAERGIFAMLPLNPDQVRRLGQDHAVHLPSSGRANLVGLKDADIPHFLAAMQAVLRA